MWVSVTNATEKERSLRIISMRKNVRIVMDKGTRWQRMTNEEREDIQFKASNEGFDYCFTCYSDFDEIEDEKFHELRKAYVAAHKELEDYLGPWEDY